MIRGGAREARERVTETKHHRRGWFGNVIGRSSKAIPSKDALLLSIRSVGKEVRESLPAAKNLAAARPASEYLTPLQKTVAVNLTTWVALVGGTLAWSRAWTDPEQGKVCLYVQSRIPGILIVCSIKSVPHESGSFDPSPGDFVRSTSTRSILRYLMNTID